MFSTLRKLSRTHIIDRFVLFQFFWNFLICFFSLAMMFVIFDLFSNLDHFMAYSDKHGWLFVLRFYLFKSIGFFDLTSGVVVLLAAAFTLTVMQRANEMTALNAAGISKLRVSMPVLLSGVAVTLLVAAAREVVFPRFAAELSQEARNLSGESHQALRPRYDNKTDVLIRGVTLVAKDRMIARPSFLLPAGLDRYGSQLAAEAAYYRAAAEGRPGGWLLKKVVQPEGLTQKPSVIDANGNRVILCPSDTDWLGPDECFVHSDVTFEQLAGGNAWLRFSSTAALVEGLRNDSLDYGADVRVAVHARFVKPLLDITLLLLGLPLVVGRENRNVFVSVGLCLLVVVLFMLTVLGAQYLGSAVYISPELAAWLPLVIFVPLAAWLGGSLRN
ncbi:MAG: LptF/LptG family permease [Planctomycetia bacterium]|nr:LptF/LptG family permease [Planctomycetia bacterium]